MSTIEDVAKAAGVSKSTVSNVFSKKRPISREVSERVIDAARELNYKPNYWARSLANKETRILGINMVGEKVKFGTFHMTLLNGVLDACYGKGYRLLVNTLPADYSNQLENWSTDPVDGEILLDPVSDDPRLEDRLGRGIPVVVIGRPSERFESSVSYVDNDNAGAGRDVTRYLLGLGHRRIVFLNAPKGRTVAQDREAGYRRALQEAGLAYDATLMTYKEDNDESSIDFGYRHAKRWLTSGSGVTAFIADTEKAAQGVYLAADELGLRIPQDVSVISFSVEGSHAPDIQPPLCSVRLNGEVLGREAAGLLIEGCAAKSKAASASAFVRRIIIPSELIPRGSCGPVVLKDNIFMENSKGEKKSNATG
ncbi:LacI family transcriptional regulator [Paenibacillus sp. TRM 82003]|nr:LacI family transcriptional regulator [Paenibacillus sp. TRM 82003]